MKISDVMKKTGLTRKAIYYYEEQGLLSPDKDSGNNYREYGEDDINRLLYINSLRQLDFSVKEIKDIMIRNKDIKGSIKQQVNSINQELYLLNKKKSILEYLMNQDKENISNELKNAGELLDYNFKKVEGYMKKKLDKILPGNVGKLFVIYYSNFLNEPIDTVEKEEAWNGLVRLLDSTEEIYYPEEVKEIVGRVWKYVIIGIGLGALIHGYAPADILAQYAGPNNPLSVIAAVAVGIPLYANAVGTIPIVEALMGKGVALGTALSFMMATTALSLPAMIILRKVIKPKLITVFVTVVGVSIIGVGYMFNFVMNII